jgi:hypothetical protein
LFGDPAVNGELVYEMCLDAAARELGFDPGAAGRGSEESGDEQEELAAEG